MKKFFLIQVVIFYCIFQLSGQENLPVATKNYFITNATITVQPGEIIPRASILLEDGLIKAVGIDIIAPPDVEIISGDSLFIYAGFIAPVSHLGIPKPKEDNNRPKVERTGYPPNDVAGITPERKINELYDKSEREINAFRKEGFTIAHSVPHGRMMPGMGSIISLNSQPFNEAIVKGEVSLYAQFSGAQRMFPATTIGVMAKWRELYRRAELAQMHEMTYHTNPVNKKRPEYDDATGGLMPVLNKRVPVFFKTPHHTDIYRALQLKDDLDFNLVLSEVKQGMMAMNEIKTAGITSLISLDLPKKEAEIDSTKVMEEETKSLTDRKLKAIEEYVSQASKFVDNTLPFSFAYMDVKASDVHANLKRMIQAGLSESDALAGLTTYAAKVLEIDDVAGTISPGKIGNLVVMTGPIFSDKSKIQFVFVDGKKYEFDIKEKKKKSGDSDLVLNLEGVWSYEIEIPGMMPSGTMTFRKDGDTYSIDLTNNQTPDTVISVNEVELDGGNMIFDYDVDAGGNTISVSSDISFDGNTFEGEVSVADFGSFPITGQKQEKPN